MASTPPAGDGIRVFAAPPFEEVADVAADDGIQGIARLRSRKLETGPPLQIGQSCMTAHASIVGHRISSFGS